MLWQSRPAANSGEDVAEQTFENGESGRKRRFREASDIWPVSELPNQYASSAPPKQGASRIRTFWRRTADNFAADVHLVSGEVSGFQAMQVLMREALMREALPQFCGRQIGGAHVATLEPRDLKRPGAFRNVCARSD